MYYILMTLLISVCICGGFKVDRKKKDPSNSSHKYVSIHVHFCKHVAHCNQDSVSSKDCANAAGSQLPHWMTLLSKNFHLFKRQRTLKKKFVGMVLARVPGYSWSKSTISDVPLACPAHSVRVYRRTTPNDHLGK